jgi:hypothetical protein
LRLFKITIKPPALAAVLKMAAIAKFKFQVRLTTKVKVRFEISNFPEWQPYSKYWQAPNSNLKLG